MSLKINKDNIYMLFSNIENDSTERLDTFMDNDFTLFARVKINKIENYDHGSLKYILGRTGRHSGLSYNFNFDGETIINFNYWFLDKDNNFIDKYLYYTLPKEIENEYNDYMVTCNNLKKIISLYVNNELKFELNYDGNEKITYENMIIWIGCGNMIIADTNYQNIGDFEIELLFGADKSLSINEVKELLSKYRTEYCDNDVFSDFPILSQNVLNIKNYKFFMDFECQNRYKIWNMINNGNFFQKYIEGNIFF